MLSLAKIRRKTKSIAVGITGGQKTSIKMGACVLALQSPAINHAGKTKRGQAKATQPTPIF